MTAHIDREWGIRCQKLGKFIRNRCRIGIKMQEESSRLRFFVDLFELWMHESLASRQGHPKDTRIGQLIENPKDFLES